MYFQQLRWRVGLFVSLLGLALFAWGAWPGGKQLRVLMLQPHDMQLALAGASPAAWEGNVSDLPAALPAILEVRRLALETPNFLRPGDEGRVRLEFTADPGLNLEGEMDELSDLYDTHHAAVKARLEMSGVRVDPPGSLTRPLAAGQAVSFSWVLVPDQERVYEGTVWFYMRFMPKDGSPSSEWPLAAQRVELSSKSIMGLSGRMARWLGGIGALAGILLLSDLRFSRLRL